jgi:ParB family transcriptional regulator, chromosome partitioning protein
MATTSVRTPAKPNRIEPHARQHSTFRTSNDSFRVGERMRRLGDIHALAASIRELGLLNPITVTREPRLVSELHRLAAFKAIGHLEPNH